MSKLIDLILEKAGIEKIKANLWDHRHNENYVNLVDKYGNSALVCACRKGDTEAVKLLLEEDADVNLVNNDGNNALIFACMNGYTEVVKLLLDANADVNIVNKCGNNALKIAEQYERTEAIELLNKCNNYVIFNGKKYKLVEDK